MIITHENYGRNLKVNVMPDCLSVSQASDTVFKPTKPSVSTLTFFTVKCVLNSHCSVRVCRVQSLPIKEPHVMQQHQQ